MNYNQLSKETFDLLYKARKSSGVPAQLKVLVELRVSKINGCEYCIKLHTDEALKLGVAQEKMDGSGLDEKEKLALEWAEAVTRLEGIAQVKERLLKVFSEKEVSDLTATICIMNALNRVAMSLRG